MKKSEVSARRIAQNERLQMQNEQMGIYRLHNGKDSISYIGFSHNLESTRKRLRFELKLNSCYNKELQKFYNDSNDELIFEVLETFSPTPSMNEEELDAHLHALLFRFKSKLNARLVQI